VHHLKVREEIGPVWFDPVKANLTGLKLHADVDWGWVPEADFRGLHFPRLRKLELGNYTFSRLAAGMDLEPWKDIRRAGAR
jgi:hypothetical protein